MLAGESAFEEFIVLAKDGKGNVQGTWTAVDSSKAGTTNCSATLKSSVSLPLHVLVCTLFEVRMGHCNANDLVVLRVLAHFLFPHSVL